MDVTNAMRAEWAFHGLRTYARVTRPSFEGIDTVDELVADPDLANEWIGDLLGDLFHLADKSGLDPMTVLDRAISYYRDETREKVLATLLTFGDGANWPTVTSRPTTPDDTWVSVMKLGLEGLLVQVTTRKGVFDRVQVVRFRDDFDGEAGIVGYIYPNDEVIGMAEHSTQVFFPVEDILAIKVY